MLAQQIEIGVSSVSAQREQGAVGSRRSELRVMLVVMAAVTALSMDVYLPSMGSIARDLGAPISDVQHSVSIFLLSFGMGQLLLGPLSDRWGRRRPLLVALCLYVAANALAALAPSLGWLLLARFVQGLGACAGAVSFVAIARDTYQGPELARVLATTSAAAALSPMIAPSLGALLERYCGWRASFGFLACFGASLAFWLARRLPETQLRPDTRAFSGLLKQYANVALDPAWRRYGSVTAGVFMTLFGFLSAAAPILIGQQRFSSMELSLCFGGNAAVYMLSSLLTGRLLRRYTTPVVALLGCVLVVLGGGAMLALAWLEAPASLLASMAVVTLGVGVATPASTALALEPFGARAGRAAGLLGFLRFGLAALAGLWLARHTSQAALGALIVSVGVLCLALAALARTGAASSEAASS